MGVAPTCGSRGQAYGGGKTETVFYRKPIIKYTNRGQTLAPEGWGAKYELILR